jgi:hypothetical protein
MHYYFEKIAEQRLDEARRMQGYADLVREARALRQRRRPDVWRSLLCRVTSWSALGRCRETRAGGAASAAAASGQLWYW